MSKRAQASDDGKNGEARIIEWILSGASAMLILALSGFLVYEAMTKTGGEPVLSLHVARILERADGQEVVVTVRNEGHATAADVEIVGRVAGDPLIRQVSLDYAPAESEREVTLRFATPFSVDALELFILGFVDP